MSDLCIVLADLYICAHPEVSFDEASAIVIERDIDELLKELDVDWDTVRSML